MSKQDAKNDILTGLGSLAILIFGYLLLKTINPDILNLNIGVGKIELEAGAYEEGFTVPECTTSGSGGSGGSDPSVCGGPAPQFDFKNPGPWQAWARANGPTFILKRMGGGEVELRACPSDDIAPVTAFGVRTQIHKDAKPYLEAVSKVWEERGKKYPIPGPHPNNKKAMGGYSCRPVNGHNNQISKHAYGITFDLNPYENIYVQYQSEYKSNQKTNVERGGVKFVLYGFNAYVLNSEKEKFVSNRNNYTDMPTDFVQIWKDKGWGWGGDWGNKKDAMHFSLFKSEGGSVVREKKS